MYLLRKWLLQELPQQQQLKAQKVRKYYNTELWDFCRRYPDIYIFLKGAIQAKAITLIFVMLDKRGVVYKIYFQIMPLEIVLRTNFKSPRQVWIVVQSFVATIADSTVSFLVN